MKVRIACVGVMAALLVGNVNAAEIDWGPVFDFTGPEAIFVPENAMPVEVVNATNSGVWYNVDLDAGFTLEFWSVGALDSPDLPGLPLLAATTGDAQYAPEAVESPDTPAPRAMDDTLLTILGSHTWQGGGGEFNLGDRTPTGEERTLLLDPGDGNVIAAPGFEPLEEGADYVLQILGVYDGRGCCFERDAIWGDGRGAEFASDPLKRGWGQTIIGNFTADDTTQLLEALPGEGGGGTDPGLSAYILWKIDGGGGNPGLTCDFNESGSCDISDIDLLMEEIGAGTNAAVFDMTGDGAVNDADRDAWLSGAATENGLSAPYFVGDSNLDLKVDATDLNAVGSNWQSESNKWSTGNFTGSGVGAPDLNGVGGNWQAQHPDAPIGAAATAAVPEPSGIALVLVGLLGLSAIRRR